MYYLYFEYSGITWTITTLFGSDFHKIGSLQINSIEVITINTTSCAIMQGFQGICKETETCI